MFCLRPPPKHILFANEILQGYQMYISHFHSDLRATSVDSNSSRQNIADKKVKHLVAYRILEGNFAAGQIDIEIN